MRRIAAVLVVIGGLVAVGVALVPPGPPTISETDWAAHRSGATDSVRVAWVGHSLMNARDPHVEGGKNLLERLADFARASGDEYESFDHTLFGAPLSLLWRGRPHGYTRDELEMREQRSTLMRNAADWDALVLTEGIPIELSREREHTAYYLQRFRCAFAKHNPDGRVYLYESWPHLQAMDPDAEYGPVEYWRWIDAVEYARPLWDQTADEAMTGRVVGPFIADRFERFLGPTDGQCSVDAPIFTIPVASAMRALAVRLREAHGWMWKGEPLVPEHLVLNPHTEWPNDWPAQRELTEAEVNATLDALPLRFPDEQIDDVHPSDLGVYFTAWVSYAVLYRKTPEGLPFPDGLVGGPDLQRFVWLHVRADPRTGI